MLQELSIRDFAIIESLDLSFATGMTALTGETGAGKSIIIDAVSLLAGTRGSSEFIRTGADKATLQGQFLVGDNQNTIDALAALGLAPDDGQVLLERDLTRTGRSVCRVNGKIVTTGNLRSVGETLVDIHGQNEHQELSHPEKHLSMLDQYADGAVHELLEQYRHTYRDYQQSLSTLRKKQQNEQEWAQRLDMLRFQVKEIDDADLHAGEEDELESERERLANFQRIQNALASAYDVFDNAEYNPVDALGEVMQQLESIADLGEDYRALSETINDAYYSLQDAQADLSKEIDGLEWDENRLNEIEERLALIQQLKRKYGDSVDDILAYGQRAHKELGTMEATSSDAAGLDGRVQQLYDQLVDLGQQLTEMRKGVAHRLTDAVHQQLKALYMAKTVFSVHFADHAQDAFTPNGVDVVEFYIQTNPGERAQPLARIASGGELSRIMLAIKTIFAESDGVTSIIFDEVDTGVSGRVAQAIANKISSIAGHSQVLCITHLPQVAAMADHEFKIAKAVHQGRTTTTVTRLSEDERVDELARMLAGTSVTQLTREHAQELLRLAEQTRAELDEHHQ
ncbi:DNA repair protein RecN [Lacticaseibacillus pantheris]|uniref:DNA repair protein RecN n=1 Tax=Lacticaseibacillus pantheris TaxID=171523 RepID=UPI002658440A|nr:DNA repair protein RecN [Lacticaseibacillus pantheris]WKF85180.1 DNA repair protein RecN [Lacticaseibacillus pantheris]